MAAQEQTNTPGKIEFYGGYQVYSESGVDLTLLRENLRRSVEERFQDNRRALTFALALREAGAARFGGTPEPRSQNVIDTPSVVTLLLSHQVEFVIIGGQAMIAQGSAHVTMDLDICYRRTPANCAALANALASIGPYLRGAPAGLPFRFDAPTIQAGMNFTLRTDLGDVDVLGEVSGIGTYEQVLAQTDELTLWGAKVRVLSIDGLIAAKRAAARGKDRDHILELEELKKLRDANP
jgi:predicted nucleotidyltransferase